MVRHGSSRLIPAVAVLLVSALPMYAGSPGWIVTTLTQQLEDISLLSVDNDTLLCELGSWSASEFSPFLRIPVEELVRIERPDRGGAAGAVIGAAVGAALGGVLWATADEVPDAWLGPVAFVPILGLLGTAVGALVGSSAHSDELADFAAMRVVARSALLQYVINEDALPRR